MTVFVRLLAISVVLATAVGLRADDYASLARAVASPLLGRREDVEKSYADGQLILRVELARQRLQSLSSVAADLSGPRKNILLHLDSCHSAMEEIRRLNGKLPDFEEIAKKALEASPALVRNDPKTGSLTSQDQRAVDEFAGTILLESLKAIADAWNTSQQRDSHRDHYRLARAESLALASVAKKRCTGTAPVGYGVGIAADITDDAIVVADAVADGPAAKAGIRKGDEIIAVDNKPVKRKKGPASEIDDAVFLALAGPRNSKVKLTYSRGGTQRTVELSRTFSFPIDIFAIDFDGSWNAALPYDGLSLRNSSDTELTNCTLLVTIIGTHGDSDKVVQERHLHFVDKWPANHSRYARYQSSSATGIATAESVDRVQQLVFDIYSDQFRDTIKYQYAGTPAFEEDTDRYVGLIGKQQKFTLTFIGDNAFTDAGVTLQHDGTFPAIPDPKLTVKLSRGNDVRTVVWRASGRHWGSGTLSAYALKDPSFNGMNPDRVDIDLEFPDSSKKISRFWTFANR